MMFYGLLIVSVFATSVVSGVLGMAGGMVLMAILVSTLSVSAAMMVHGVVQATANGSRTWFLRRHVRWRILPPYLVGAALALMAFTLLSLVPDPSVVLLAVGGLPWVVRFMPKLNRLDMTRPATAGICGLLVTAAQLLAGASGPLLDLFYLNSNLTRHQVVANKAITQTLGHLLKLVYYGWLVGVTDSVPLWLYGIAAAAAVAGTRLGTRLLDHIADGDFRRVSAAIILAIAAGCIVKGLWGLWAT